jgi:hypothetical protein
LIFVCCECRVLSGRGLCEEVITRPKESYRLCCVVVCDLETSRIGAPYIFDISSLRVKYGKLVSKFLFTNECTVDCLKNENKFTIKITPTCFGAERTIFRELA